MSNDNIKGEVVFFCDAEDCDETLESGEGRFSEANAVRTDAGWIAFKNTETQEWEHRCAVCKRQPAAEPRRYWDRD